MSTSCSDIIARARSFNTLNSGLTTDSTEMLSRIRADQQRVFTAIAGQTRDRFKTTESLTSTSGASGRSFDLSAVDPPIERVLRLVLSDGREVNPVDELDTDAELAPRYYVRGETLYEVDDDWGASGAKTATLTYVYGASEIDISGSLTQEVTIPDNFTDVLVLPLAGYLASKDPGRDPGEMQRLALMLDEANESFSDFLTNYGGVPSSRFILPNPLRQSAPKA